MKITPKTVKQLLWRMRIRLLSNPHYQNVHVREESDIRTPRGDTNTTELKLEHMDKLTHRPVQGGVKETVKTEYSPSLRHRRTSTASYIIP